MPELGKHRGHLGLIGAEVPAGKGVGRSKRIAGEGHTLRTVGEGAGRAIVIWRAGYLGVVFRGKAILVFRGPNHRGSRSDKAIPPARRHPRTRVMQ